MSVPVGITVPKLFPVTGAFAPAFAAYYLYLNLQVSAVRSHKETYLGSKGDDDQKLLVADRSHGNFVENVPMALLVAAIAEANGGNRRTITGSLAALLLFRIVHVELGLKSQGSLGWGRPIGYFGTLGFVAGMSGYAAYLVKSYWGF
ncbi:membrane-associated, eicosanoid/glutathione metabolism protein [Exophiala viscosa]|uniref:Membrane-associated, eicosanoid/glutathione metabolism protein n=1 Tax=Exophiala viscosa TaxID=2486360 RepID=A0AAN6E381_9EURO|nr:membrane-associated, eicosanoid/glutathione metabolism protein [Exophiala viscosa]KAI1629141.1 membrane-associated, eicosanoid/glutathione metabolism protein [Exophiala viscosa]